MAWEDELQQLRTDLRRVLLQANNLSERLTQLEDEVKGTQTGRVSAPPPIPIASSSELESEVPEMEIAAPVMKAGPTYVSKETVGPLTPSASLLQAPDRTIPSSLPATPPATPLGGFLDFELNKVFAYFQGHIDRLKAKTREQGIEMSLGTYLLPRVAVLCIAIAVVFFLSLAIKRWGSQWMPHLRVLIGYAVCTGLMVSAWRSEKKYTELSRVLYGGGFAVMYFVTFATYYVKFAQIFASPYPTLCLLTAIVLAWFAAAQIRQSKIIAVLVTALGHFTVLLSTLTLVRPGPYAMAGALVLSAGSAFFLLRNGWYYVAALGMAGSYINDFVVLSKSKGGDPVTDFIGAMSVLSAFLLIFALAELFSPTELRRNRVPVWFRNLFVAVNSVCFLLIGSLLMSNFDFTKDHQDLFRFCASAVLLGIGFAYLYLREADPLFNVYLIKGVTVFTLGLSARYGDSSLSAFLAVEAAALLWSSQRLKLVVTRLLAFTVAILAIAQTFNASQAVFTDYAHAGYYKQLFEAVLSALAFFVASYFYQRTDWSLCSPLTAKWLHPEGQMMCWQLDLIVEKPSVPPNLEKPFEGLFLPYLYAAGGVILFLINTYPLAMFGHRFAAIAVFASILLFVSVFINSKPFAFAAILLCLAAFPTGLFEVASLEKTSLIAVLVGFAGLTLNALASETEFWGSRPTLYFHQQKISPYLLYAMTAFLIGLRVAVELNAYNECLGMVLAACIAGGLSLLLHSRAFAGITTGYLVWGAALYLGETVFGARGSHAYIELVAGCLVVASLAGERFFESRRSIIPFVSIAGAILVLNAWLVISECLNHIIVTEWKAFAFALLSFAFMAYFGAFRSPAAIILSISGALITSFSAYAKLFDLQSFNWGWVMSFAVLVAFWMTCEQLLGRFGEAVNEKMRAGKIPFDPGIKPVYFPAIPIVFITMLMLNLMYHLPLMLQASLVYITIGWFALAIGLYMVSLVCRQRFYRYAGLAVIALSLARVFLIDMKEQDPLLRVAAFAVVGIGLLALSYGYFRWMARVRRTNESTVETKESTVEVKE